MKTEQEDEEAAAEDTAKAAAPSGGGGGGAEDELGKQEDMEVDKANEPPSRRSSEDDIF